MSGQELSRLVAILADGLRVWVKRGEVELTEDQIFERARNQAQAVMGEYMLIRRPEAPAPVDFDTSLIGPAPRHMYGCRCGNCPGEFPVDTRRLSLAEGPRETRPPGVVLWHGWSCMCASCADAKQKERL